MVRLDYGACDGQSHAHSFRLAGEKRLEDLAMSSGSLPAEETETAALPWLITAKGHNWPTWAFVRFNVLLLRSFRCQLLGFPLRNALSPCALFCFRLSGINLINLLFDGSLNYFFRWLRLGLGSRFRRRSDYLLFLGSWRRQRRFCGRWKNDTSWRQLRRSAGPIPNP
jgi:hypothetical protein